ncbi:RNA polymerase Rpb4 [Popillia japonica]|uniref:DNA-directed RNA polymerase III subunit RPC9 n=1 Tax=Popillia japonica TaxID=7064 RepID=A0AAW1LQ51_POPJA
MEIVNANVATLCNYEVMTHLQKMKDTRKKQTGQLATITYETIRYLEGTPCQTYTSNNVIECLKALEQFNITKNEKLMIINIPPTTALEIQLIVEESEERLTEQHVEEILKICAKYLNVTPKNNDDVEEG